MISKVLEIVGVRLQKTRLPFSSISFSRISSRIDTPIELMSKARNLAETLGVSLAAILLGDGVNIAARLEAIAGDLKATGAIEDLSFAPEGDAINVDVTLA